MKEQQSLSWLDLFAIVVAAITVLAAIVLLVEGSIESWGYWSIFFEIVALFMVMVRKTMDRNWDRATFLLECIGIAILLYDFFI